jgi:hypothetical protein
LAIADQLKKTSATASRNSLDELSVPGGEGKNKSKKGKGLKI